MEVVNAGYERTKFNEFLVVLLVFRCLKKLTKMTFREPLIPGSCPTRPTISPLTLHDWRARDPTLVTVTGD